MAIGHVRGADRKATPELRDTGPHRPHGDAHPHRQEDPDGQVAIEQRQPARDTLTHEANSLFAQFIWPFYHPQGSHAPSDAPNVTARALGASW